MHINRSLLNWGVFLIALGGIPLAVDQGWLEPHIASDLGQLWPLILVGIGLGLILRWTPLSWFGGALVAATFGIIFGAVAVSLRDSEFSNLQGLIPAVASGACANGDVGDDSTTRDGLAAGDAFELEVTMPCGELNVSRASNATWRVDAAHESGEAPRIDGTEAELEVSDGSGDELVFIGRQAQSRWDVEVPAESALTVRVTLDAAKGTIDVGSGPVTQVAGTFNAADATIDLSEADTPETAEIELTLNASDADLSLPMGTVRVSATLNASSLSVCAPEDLPLQVEISETLSSSDFAGSGLEEAGGSTWTTPGFSTSGPHASLEITSTVSSLTIERPEVCS